MRTNTGLFFLLIFLCLNASAEDIAFSGKVIDWDTLEPIEGAVVVARWDKSRAGWPAEGTDRFHDAREAVTDKNGDWEIRGPKGNTETFDKDLHHLISLIFRKYYIQDPYFFIYKPGYFCNRTSYAKGPVSFRAYPYINTESDIEGIILERRGVTWEESRAYSEKYDGGFKPLVPTDDPEMRLRDLDFSFEYPESTLKVHRTELKEKGIKPFSVYTVVGLRKTATEDERKRAMRALFFVEGLPIATQMYWKERELLLGTHRRKTK
jgi:hypothetical protein